MADFANVVYFNSRFLLTGEWAFPSGIRGARRVAGYWMLDAAHWMPDTNIAELFVPSSFAQGINQQVRSYGYAVQINTVV